MARASIDSTLAKIPLFKECTKKELQSVSRLVTPISVKAGKVLTKEGEPLKRYPFQIEQRFDPASIYLIQNAMQRVMREGTGSSVYNVLPKTLTLAGTHVMSNHAPNACKPRV